MANIRYELEWDDCNPPSGSQSYRGKQYAYGPPGRYGLAVLELPPQQRTVFCTGNQGILKLHFPYIVQIITYQVEDNNYIFHGIFNRGLCVWLANKSLNSFNDNLYYCPTEAGDYPYGMVCTNHAYDGEVFATRNALLNCVSDLWAGAVHVLEVELKEKWRRMSHNQVMTYRWGSQVTLREALGAIEDVPFYSRLGSKDLPVPEFATLKPLPSQQSVSLKLA